jgi:hypothetical protein
MQSRQSGDCLSAERMQGLNIAIRQRKRRYFRFEFGYTFA